MIEAYKIGAALIVETNAKMALGEFGEMLKVLNEALDVTTGKANTLRTALGKIGDRQATIKAMTSAVNGLGTALGTAADNAARLGGSMMPAASGAQAAAAAWERTATAMKAATVPPAPTPGTGFNLVGGPTTPTNFQLSGPSYGAPQPMPRTLPSGMQMTTTGLGGALYAGGAGGAGGGGMIPPGAGAGGPGGLVPGSPGILLNPPRMPNYFPPMKLPTAAALRSGAHSAMIDGGIGAVILEQFLKQPLEAGADYSDEIAKLRGQGFSPEQAAAASTEANKMVNDVPSSTVIGNLKLISDAMTVLQNVDESMAVAPAFARLGVVLRYTNSSEEGEGLMQAMRAAEFEGVLVKTDPTTGKQSLDIARMQSFIKEIQSVNAATGGTIGPQQMLQFLRSAGVAGTMLDDSTLFGMVLPLIQSLGPGRAGTAIQALNMQWDAGKMSKAAYGLAQDMSIFSEDPKTFKNLGIGQVMLLPGAYSDAKVQQLEREKPLQFITDYLQPRIREYLHKSMGAAYDRPNESPEDRAKHQLQDVIAFFPKISSRIPAGTAAAEALRTILLGARDEKAVIGASDRDLYGIQTGENTRVQLDAMTASWNAFMIALGEGGTNVAVAAMHDITDVLHSLTAWAHDNPEQVAADLKALSLALVGFTATAAAGAALLVLTNPVTGLVALATAIQVLGRAMSSIPPTILNMLSFGSLGAGIGARIGGAPGAAIGAGTGAAAALGYSLDTYQIDQMQKALADPATKSFQEGGPLIPGRTGLWDRLTDSIIRGIGEVFSGHTVNVHVVNADQVGDAAGRGSVTRLANTLDRTSGGTQGPDMSISHLPAEYGISPP